MTRPFRCPVCDGQGKMNKPPWVAGDQETWSGTSVGPWECHACKGTGIVWDVGSREASK